MIFDKKRGQGGGADAAQQAVQRAIDQFPDHAKSGAKLSAVAVPPAGATVTVAHGLGRVPQGWHSLRAQGAASTTLHAPIEIASNDKTITFARDATSAGLTTHDFWVF